ncbi:hypothetical protein AB0939_06850 [Streptomyces sp. NPDC006990]|uniref:hypothetical protein n=1 Tax=unclassified Streptomyces TaxID=2593676 RepID=UPI003455F5D9
MSRVRDDEQLTGAYERGNEMPEASLRAWVEVCRPQSKFTHLTDEEFHRGLVRLEAGARSEALDEPRPVLERYDVAVFSRS